MDFASNSMSESNNSVRKINMDHLITLEKDDEEDSLIIITDTPTNNNSVTLTVENQVSELQEANTLTFWHLFFDQEIILEIIGHTNKKILHSRSKYKTAIKADTSPVDMVEFRALMGLLVYTMVFRCNQDIANVLFATDGTAREIFRATMSKSRFLFLLSCLRFDDFTTRQERLQTDKLAAVSGMFSKFVNNCQNNYKAPACIKMDEHIIGFRGQPKDKKSKEYMIKIKDICDADNNYYYNAFISTGGDSESRNTILDEAEKNTNSSLKDILNMPSTSTVKYTCKRTSRRWPMTLFFRMIDMSVVNAHILYSNAKNKTINFEAFMRDLARELVLQFLKGKAFNSRVAPDMRITIGRILGEEMPPPPLDPTNLTPSRPVKTTCKICPAVRKRKTNHTCKYCQTPVCMTCARAVCIYCLPTCK